MFCYANSHTVVSQHLNQGNILGRQQFGD